MRYTGTLTGREDAGNGNSCSVLKGRTYTASYNDFETFTFVGGGKISQPVFSLTIDHYKSTTAKYSGFGDLTLIVGVPKHAYINAPATKLQVQVLRAGLGGTFSATHMAVERGFHGRTVNIRGSWTCTTLLSS